MVNSFAINSQGSVFDGWHLTYLNHLVLVQVSLQFELWTKTNLFVASDRIQSVMDPPTIFNQKIEFSGWWQSSSNCPNISNEAKGNRILVYWSSLVFDCWLDDGSQIIKPQTNFVHFSNFQFSQFANQVKIMDLTKGIKWYYAEKRLHASDVSIEIWSCY